MRDNCGHIRAEVRGDYDSYSRTFGGGGAEVEGIIVQKVGGGLREVCFGDKQDMERVILHVLGKLQRLGGSSNVLHIPLPNIDRGGVQGTGSVGLGLFVRRFLVRKLGVTELLE